MVTVKKINGKYRLVDSRLKAALSKNGKPIDGGGHKDLEKANRQAGYINSYIAGKAE